MTPYKTAVAGGILGTCYRQNQTPFTVFYPYPSYTRELRCPSVMNYGDHKNPTAWWFVTHQRWAGQWQNCRYGDQKDYDIWTGNTVSIPDDLLSGLYTDPKLDQAQAEAYSKLLEAIRGSTDLSVDAFQAKQTANMPRQIKQILTVVKDAVTIRRGLTRKINGRLFTRTGLNISRDNKLKGLIHSTGDSWLLFQYGVKPTLQSIHDAVNFKKNFFCNNEFRFEGKSRVIERVSKSYNGYPDSNFTGKVEGFKSFRSEAVAHMKIPDDDTTQAARLTSLNPASIAWELLPWSFVVDWFVDIGGYLRDLETRLVFGRYFVSGFYNRTSLIDVELTVERNVVFGDVRGTGKMTSRGRDTSFARAVMTQLPEVSPPRWAPKLGSGRLLNAAALLSQFISR